MRRARARLSPAALLLAAERDVAGAVAVLLGDAGHVHRVNLPAIQYYFGSKEGLYRAAIEHIGKFVEDRMAAHTARVLAALERKDVGEPELFALLFEMLDGFIDLITCSETPPSAALLIARAEIENAAALEVLQQRVRNLVFLPSIALVARLLGRSEDDEETKIRTFAIFGQALVFKNHGTKPGACPFLGWSDVDEVRLHRLQALLREQTEAILRAAKAKTS